jgi:hypothetical protein
MIALQIIPLRWADPESRKVLVHDESKPSQRFAGEDGEGFYSVLQGINTPEFGSLVDYCGLRLADNSYPRIVAPSDLPLYCVVWMDGGSLNGVYIEHFSAPTDYDDHYEESPLLADTQSGPVAVHPSPQQTLRGAR